MQRSISLLNSSVSQGHSILRNYWILRLFSRIRFGWNAGRIWASAPQKPNLPGLGMKIRSKNGQLNDPVLSVLKT